MTENKTSSAETIDLDRLKRAWERLQQEQKTVSYARKGATISSVKIVADGKGRKRVQICLSNGGKINDIGDKRDVFRLMMPKKRINFGRLMALIEAVRSFGFTAVAMGLPPELKRALLQACKQCGVPLKIEQKKYKAAVLNKTSSNSLPNKSPFMTLLKDKDVFFRPSTVTSPHSLDITIRQLQKQNKDYLCDRLLRCENDIKNDFFDLCRKQLRSVSRKETTELTREEKKLLKFAERYGLNSDKAIENPTLEQKKQRTSLTLSDLPPEFQKKYKECKKHYNCICRMKNKALEVTQTELKCQCQKEKPLNLSLDEIVQNAISLLPPKGKYDQKNLIPFMANIDDRLKKTKDAFALSRKEKYKNITALLTKTIKSLGKENSSFDQSKLQTETKHRQSFIQNVLVQNLIKDRQTAY